MARAKASGKTVARVQSKGASNRRGSPEAIEKRRVARMFNDHLGGHGGQAGKLDGRTEKRRQRLLRELEENKAHGQKELKPLDVLTRVQELLELGEPLASIKKARKFPKPLVTNAATVELLQRLDAAYHFRKEAYRFVGITDEVLVEAGLVPGERPKRGARRRRAA
jgi:hypothetical protein